MFWKNANSLQCGRDIIYSSIPKGFRWIESADSVRMEDSEILDDNLDTDNENDQPDSISDEDSGGVPQFPPERPRQEIWPTEEIRETLQVNRNTY